MPSLSQPPLSSPMFLSQWVLSRPWIGWFVDIWNQLNAEAAAIASGTTNIAGGGGGVPLGPGGTPSSGTPVPPGTPTVTSLPGPTDPLSSPGQQVIFNGSVYVFTAGLVGPDGYWAIAVTGAPTIRDTFANLSLYPATNYAVGTVFQATDWLVSYAVQNTDIGLQWTYYNGIYEAPLASIPGTLGVNDINFTFRASDYLHSWIWNGSAWNFTTGGFPAGYIIQVQSPAYLPPGALWHALDGSTVPVSQNNGTTAPETLANVAGEYIAQ